MQNSPDLWRSFFPAVKPDGHKYDRGTALIYGDTEMTGAPRLAARAAQRIGAGMVFIATPKQSVDFYAKALESVIVREANDEDAWQTLVSDPKKNAILIGPGLALGQKQAALVLTALKSRKPCVLDAGALTNFTQNPETLISELHPACVLTPHEGEFQNVFGSKMTETDKIQRTIQAAKMAGCIVLLKGSQTIIAAPNGDYIVNDNAPPWLATAGAGDVLAGIILGLIAQKMPVLEAAAAAAWLHGDIANAFGCGLIAEDIVEGIPAVLQKLWR